MSKEFYEFCVKQYDQEMKEAEGIYQRGGVMLVVIPLLSAGVFKLGRIDILKLLFLRVDTFIYYLAITNAVIVLAISVLFLFLCIYPRKKYKTLANMNFWKEWRGKYREYLETKNAQSVSGSKDELDIATINNLCQKLIEAQPINAEINEKRRRAFQKSVLAGSIALFFIGLQALFYLILKIQGV